MIELVVEALCDGCGACVEACPRNVFDLGGDGRAVIARQDDCQTCFLCELYCPTDALYVAPLFDRRQPADPASIVASGLLGQFRRDSGWGEWADEIPNEHWRMGEIFERSRSLAQRAAAPVSGGQPPRPAAERAVEVSSPRGRLPEGD